MRQQDTTSRHWGVSISGEGRTEGARYWYLQRTSEVIVSRDLSNWFISTKKLYLSMNFTCTQWNGVIIKWIIFIKSSFKLIYKTVNNLTSYHPLNLSDCSRLYQILKDGLHKIEAHRVALQSDPKPTSHNLNTKSLQSLDTLTAVIQGTCLALFFSYCHFLIIS